MCDMEVKSSESYSRRGCVDRRLDVLYDCRKNMMTRKSIAQNPVESWNQEMSTTLEFRRGCVDRR